MQEERPHVGAPGAKKMKRKKELRKMRLEEEDQLAREVDFSISVVRSWGQKLQRAEARLAHARRVAYAWRMARKVQELVEDEIAAAGARQQKEGKREKKKATEEEEETPQLTEKDKLQAAKLLTANDTEEEELPNWGGTSSDDTEPDTEPEKEVVSSKGSEDASATPLKTQQKISSEIQQKIQQKINSEVIKLLGKRPRSNDKEGVGSQAEKAEKKGRGSK